jgi:beta-phosphoglucomutase-like phosphatase (HAD superfamily)
VHGRNNKEILEYFFSRPLPIDEVDLLCEQKERIYRALCLGDPGSLHLAGGLPGLLNAIKDCDIPMTIATASRKSNVDFYVEQFHLGRWFDVGKIVYDDDTFPGKPNPDIYLKASRIIGVEPMRCIVFEDSVSGMQAAYNAGIGRIIAVAKPSSRDSFMGMKEVNDVIQDYHEFDRSWMRAPKRSS